MSPGSFANIPKIPRTDTAIVSLLRQRKPQGTVKIHHASRAYTATMFAQNKRISPYRYRHLVYIVAPEDDPDDMTVAEFIHVEND